MNSTNAKAILTRTLAFLATAFLSLAIMNSLPRIKEQRQRSFAQAAADGSVYRLRWLHFAGARVNVAGSCCLPLFLAAGDGKLAAVRYLLDEGADVNAHENRGHTALSEAAYYGHLDVVKELLLRGADVNADAGDGTALDLAIARKNTAVADLLKHRGGKTAREIRSGG